MDVGVRPCTNHRPPQNSNVKLYRRVISERRDVHVSSNTDKTECISDDRVNCVLLITGLLIEQPTITICSVIMVFRSRLLRYS